jgi:hypothetical protein
MKDCVGLERADKQSALRGGAVRALARSSAEPLWAKNGVVLTHFEAAIAAAVCGAIC